MLLTIIFHPLCHPSDITTPSIPYTLISVYFMPMLVQKEFTFCHMSQVKPSLNIRKKNLM